LLKKTLNCFFCLGKLIFFISITAITLWHRQNFKYLADEIYKHEDSANYASLAYIRHFSPKSSFPVENEVNLRLIPGRPFIGSPFFLQLFGFPVSLCLPDLVQPGTDVMILKEYFRPKNGVKLGFCSNYC
jgi:hypothetical protein